MTRMRGLRGGASALVMALTATGAVPAFAQDTPLPAPVAQGEAAEAAPGDIVVTATRRSEALSKVPLSIQAISAASIDVQGIRDIGDIARTTPGLTLQATSIFGGSNVSIRGIFSNIGAATTGVYIDDTPVQVRNGIDAGLQPIYGNIFDLDRVEVLRGPQGTLFGAGSEGGTIRYIMTRPGLHDWSTYGRTELAFTERGSPTYEAGVAVGGPLIEGTLGARASAWYRKEGGYIDRIASTVVSDGRTIDKDSNSREMAAFRLALLWQPSDSFSLEPAVTYQFNNLRDTNLNWDIDGRYKQEGKSRQPANNAFLIASNTANLDVGGVTITSVTSYLNGLGTFNLDEAYFDGATVSGFFDVTDPVRGGNAIALPEVADFTADYRTRTRLRQFSQEMRVASTDATAPVTWVAGLYYQDTRSNSKQREYEPKFDALFQALVGLNTEDILGSPLLPGGISYLQNVAVREGQFAGFADVNFKLTNRLKLEVGGRYAWTRYSFDRFQDGPWNGGAQSTSGRQRERAFTPKVGINYDVDGGVLYANAAKGYRIGGANASLAGNLACQNEVQQVLGQPDVPLSYKSDSLWSYEIGGKGHALGRRLTFGASAFYVNWSNIQGNIALKCLFSFTSNLGHAVSRGFDFSASARVTDTLTLGADLGYVDAHYDRDYRFNGALLAKNGDALSTPDFTAHIFADYRQPVGSGSGYGRVDYSYASPYRTQPSADVVGADPTIARVDRTSQLSARVGYVVGGVDISVFADNLLNDGGRQFQSRWGGSAYYLSLRPRPRTVGLTATIRR